MAIPPTRSTRSSRRSGRRCPRATARDYVNPGTPCTESPRGRDYFGGDLKGVDQELDYLQALGVTVLYLNPIFDAGVRTTATTRRTTSTIDPFFGTQKDWENLQ